MFATVSDYVRLVLVFNSLLNFINGYEIGDKRNKIVVKMEEKLGTIKRLDCGVTVNMTTSVLGVRKRTIED